MTFGISQFGDFRFGDSMEKIRVSGFGRIITGYGDCVHGDAHQRSVGKEAYILPQNRLNTAERSTISQSVPKLKQCHHHRSRSGSRK